MMKTPKRMCVVCRESFEKEDLIRIVRVENNYIIENNHKINGRSAYICKSKECLDNCIKKKMLNKSFKTAIPDDVYKTLGEIKVEN